MREATPANPYEVTCTHCRVTFPVGTRTCVHCGQRIGRAVGMAPTLMGRGPFEEELPEEAPARSLAFSPTTFVWLLAAVATVVYRSCQ